MSLTKFFKHFSHYFIGNVFSYFTGFITFPILTRVLNRGQYGILGLINITVFLLVAISKMGTSGGIIRFYAGYSKTPEQRTLFSSTVIIRGLFISILITALYILTFPYVKNLLKIDDQYVICFIIMSGYIFFHSLSAIVPNFLRAVGRTIFLNTVLVVGKVFSITASLVFLIYVIQKFYGYFIGIVIGEFAIAITFFIWFLKNYNINFKKTSWDLSVKLLKFGIPLVFYELSFLLLTYADRYMIMAFRGESELGLYSAGYNLAMYIGNALALSLGYAITPLYVKIYENEGREKTEKFLSKSMYYILIFVITFSVGYYAVSKDLFIVLASKKYEEAAYF